MHPIRLFALVGVSVGTALAAGALFQPEPDVELAGAPAGAAATATASTTGQGSLISLERIVGSGRAATEAACEPELQVAAGPAAMLSVQVSAPCEAGKTVSLVHGPLRLSQPLGQDGQLTMNLPALAEDARVTVTLADGRSVTDATAVPELAAFTRLVIGWSGGGALDLNAYRGNAGWGEDGHVRIGGPISAQAGFVIGLGASEREQARVYTYPAGTSPHDGTIAVEAEIAIDPAICGRSFEARVHMIRPELPVAARMIRVQMPACGMSGGFVLLHDLLPENPVELDFAALN